MQHKTFLKELEKFFKSSLQFTVILYNLQKFGVSVELIYNLQELLRTIIDLQCSIIM